MLTHREMEVVKCNCNLLECTRPTESGLFGAVAGWLKNCLLSLKGALFAKEKINHELVGDICVGK